MTRSLAFTLRSLLLAALPFVLMGCSSDESPEDTSDAGELGDGSLNTVCADDARAMTYAQGLTVKGKNGLYALRIESIFPDPIYKGDNTWTLQVLGADEQPVVDASLTVEKPFMPDHGHGSSIKPEATSEGDGRFTVSRLNLFMPGLWDMAFTVTGEGGESDVVTFTFCVGG